jgi:hypothetical protein
MTRPSATSDIHGRAYVAKIAASFPSLIGGFATSASAPAARASLKHPRVIDARRGHDAGRRAELAQAPNRVDPAVPALPRKPASEAIDFV